MRERFLCAAPIRETECFALGAHARRMARAVVALAVMGIVIAGSGCRTVPKVATTPVFFPAPPDPPRVQYLRAFSTRSDVAHKYSWVDWLVGPSEAGRTGFLKPYGLAVTRGKFYLCDTIPGTVWVVDFARGNFQPIAGDRRQGKLRKPINVVIDADGKKYVADVERGEIVVFGSDDEYVTAFGQGEDLKPTDLAIAGDQMILTDLNKHEIQVRDKHTGKLVRAFGSPESAGLDESVGQPTNIALDTQGNILVSDAGRFRISAFSREGSFQGSFGQIGRQAGQFARPKGIAVDRAGRIYVVDAAFENVQIFDDQHRLLMWFGGHGSDEGSLVLPAQIVINYDNPDYFRKYVAPGYDLDCVIWVTSQDGPRKVSCFGLLQPKSPETTRK